MTKYSKIMLFVMLAVVMLAGSAFAGTTQVNHGALNGTYSAGVEVMGAARNVTLTGAGGAGGNIAAGNLPISYLLGQAITSGSLLNVSFSGAAFNGVTYVVCAAATNNAIVDATNGAGGNRQLGSKLVTAGLTSDTFVLTVPAAANVAAGNWIWLTDNLGGANACSNAPAANMGLQLSTRTSAGNATVTLSILNNAGTINLDSASTANLVTFTNEFIPALTTADTVTIDYLGTPGTGVQLTTAGAGSNVLAGGANKLSITKAAVNLGAINATAANVSAAGNISLLLTLSDSNSWAGINRVWAQNVTAGNAVCAHAANVGSINATPSGTNSITVTQAAYNGSTVAANIINLCVEVNATSVQSTRTITGNYQIVNGITGGNSISAAANTAWQTWVVNGYQGTAPWLINNTAAPAYCIVNNSGTTTANMYLNLLTTEGGTLPGTITLGTLAAGKSKTFMFGTDNVTEVTTGVTGTPIAITGLTAGARYSGRFTVTSAPASTQVNCVQTYSTGSRSGIPVLVNNNHTANGASQGYLQQ